MTRTPAIAQPTTPEVKTAEAVNACTEWAFTLGQGADRPSECASNLTEQALEALFCWPC